MSERINSPRTSLRSPSSLSCDPNHQPPPTTVPEAIASPVTAEGKIQSPSFDKSEKMTFPQFRAKSLKKTEEQKQRPRSWFPLSRPSFRGLPTRSFSLRLPKDTSCVSVGRSIISAPILTATTNMNVAESEGVCCRDVIDAGLTARVEKVSTCEDLDSNEDHSPIRAISDRLQLFNKQHTRYERESKTCSLLHDGHTSDSGQKSEDTWRFSAVEKAFTRRRAEAINLCREKINKLTGNGHVKRKSVNKAKLNTFKVVKRPGNGNIIAKLEPQSHNLGQVEFLSLSNGDPDFTFGSLTRSFASAVDKLDLYSTLTPNRMSFVKSKSSIFNLKKKTKPTEDAGSNISSPQQQNVPVTQPKVVPQSDGKNLARDVTVREAMKQVQQAHPDHRTNIVGARHPQPAQFSELANDYVPAQPVPNYPRGVRALGMHSNVMEFARPPSWVTDLPVPPQHTPTREEVTPVAEEVAPVGEDGDDEHLIQDAPIYSPSSGDLSQYARSTPPPAQPVVESGLQQQEETPTRRQAEKSYMRRLGLRKSQSGSGLLNIFNKGQKNQDGKSGPLTALNTNQKSDKVQQLKKSRSMNLASLLRKGDKKTVREKPSQEAQEAPSQLTKPSPLRYETVFDEPMAVPEVVKRTPPRGSVTAADRAKRMGIVGMPKEDFSDLTKEEE